MSDDKPGAGDISDQRHYGPQGGSFEAPEPKVPLKLEEGIAAAAIALICLISLANVVVRYATNASFAFTEEFSVFLLVVMTLCGAAVGFARHEHIKILFFLQRMPPRLRLAAEFVTLAVTTILFSMVIYYGAMFTYDQWFYEETSAGLGYPSWIYSIWLPILSAIILLRILERAWLTARPAKRRDNGGSAAS